jgi:carboxylesterase type B
MEEKDYQLSEQMVSYLYRFAVTGNPNKSGELPTWIASGRGQNRVLMLGEQPTAMGKPNLLKMIVTMLTNKAVGE